MVSLKTFLYRLIFGVIFSFFFFVTNKVFTSFFTKVNYHFINICVANANWVFKIVKFPFFNCNLINDQNFLIHPLYKNKKLDQKPKLKNKQKIFFL